MSPAVGATREHPLQDLKGLGAAVVPRHLAEEAERAGADGQPEVGEELTPRQRG
jgi:hypothetical protein